MRWFKKDRTQEYWESTHERDKYYTKLLIDIMDGGIKQKSGVVLLNPVDGHFGYFFLGDTIVYVGGLVGAHLDAVGIKIDYDSSRNLILKVI